MDEQAFLQQQLSAFCNQFPSIENRFKSQFSSNSFSFRQLLQLLAESFLDVQYTLPVIYYFKTISPLILSFLIEHHRNLNVQQQKLVHEFTTIALCKSLPIYNKNLILFYLLKNFENRLPLPEQIIALAQDIQNEQQLSLIIQLLQASHTILEEFPTLFVKKWNWSCILPLLKHQNQSIQWYTAKCSEIILNFENSEIIQQIDPNYLGKEFDQFLNTLEQNYLHKQLSFVIGNTSSSLNIAIEQPSESLVNICGVWLPKKQTPQQEPRKLVYTKTTVENLKNIAMYISRRNKPVLLEGITGSGKTALVEHLAHVTGNNDLIKVNLDESFDSKDLLGTYVCTDVPGEFKWQPGALTKAVQLGKWILIEDIDLAPFDIISTLIPLIESNNLFIPSRDEVIPAAQGFQLFATQSLIENINGHVSRQRAFPLANLWQKVYISKLSAEEMGQVFDEKYPLLKSLTPKFIHTFQTLRGQAVSDNETENALNDLSVKIEDDSTEKDGQVMEHAKLTKEILQLKNFGRFFSFRDLLKWIERINRLYSNSIVKKQYLVSEMQQDIFREAVDVFCGMIAKKSVFVGVVSKIAEVWNITEERVNYFVSLYKPRLVEEESSVTIGRILIPLDKKENQASFVKKNSKFAHTKQSLNLLERIAICVRMCEPVLLTGETGVGKTTIVQYLSNLMNRRLIVHNLNQQTDSADFIGGFKPVDLKLLANSIKNQFEKLFSLTFSKKQNEGVLEKLAQAFETKNWRSMISLLTKVTEKAIQKCSANSEEREAEESNEKRKKGDREIKLLKFWKSFEEAIHKFNHQQKLVQNSFAFSFIEGSLVKALKEGHWILLDEINLASTETLERLSSLLDGEEGTLFITEKGDTEPIKRHPNFRIFACMNPPTDIGKKNLPPALRNRFTEFYVPELEDPEDLKVVVNQYLSKFISHPPTDDVVKFYLEARAISDTKLSDGAGQKPHYSLRTLSRSLEYTTTVLKMYGLERALYEGFCMGFLTQLSRECFQTMESLIKKFFMKKIRDSDLVSVPQKPGSDFVQFEHFWLKQGPSIVENPSHFILTASVREHLKNLARVVNIRKYPILLQGPTSSGKTSMVQYLAKRTGHRFVRINNHESTDLQEYFGSYITNSEGKLVFQEGILVEAVRNGYWIVLDELNLAPSDILEALNRLLDDNRELFIPETQETIKPHPEFQLFATQNPPGLYGGRKVLSRAFRNRFLELHVDDIPGEELETILQLRYSIPSSYAKKLVAVMKDLQTLRQSSKLFAGKGGFITPRDLFRWAERKPDSNEALAMEGYILLAERLRKEDEKKIVQKVLEKHMKVVMDVEKLYDTYIETEEYRILQRLIEKNPNDKLFSKLVWTKTMKRLFTLVLKCIRHKEPVLLVGETGCGKTTICQLFSRILEQELYILNCHQHTETSDFLGSLRPVRGRDVIGIKLREKISAFSKEAASLKLNVSVQIPSADAAEADYTSIIQSMRQVVALINEKRVEMEQSKKKNSNTFGSVCLELNEEVLRLYQEYKSLFIWYDGPLVDSMKKGKLFLIDEISLAEDAVLERLNSVLEPSRGLTLPEKGSEEVEEIIAHDKFRIMATMNPGGDFGKKELSPALRNRFTEFYVPSLSIKEDLAIIIAMQLHETARDLTPRMVEFVEKFKAQKAKRILSIRDVISWIEFINMAVSKLKMSKREAFLHGAEVVVLEGLGIGTDVSDKIRVSLRLEYMTFLIEQIAVDQNEKQRFVNRFIHSKYGDLMYSNPSDKIFGFEPFYIAKGPAAVDHFNTKRLNYTLEAPTTAKNVLKILRALQLNKPLLLEGSPGVGKTSLMTALAKVSGHNVVRINLSEQTDMMDLLGSDLPVAGAEGGTFQWSDGIFLRALKAGDWVLLDELNLASQSVLEGLNSVLDHRAEIYIPELNKTFNCPSSFRIFACQNPLQQGGGRKGLPKSFLNRFTQIYIEEQTPEDLLFIAGAIHGEIGEENLKNMIEFNRQMQIETMINFKFGRKGSPWEFNLRDVFRWCELLKSDFKHCSSTDISEYVDPSKYIDCVYRQRMRTEADRKCVTELYERVFNKKYIAHVNPQYTLSTEYVQIGSSILQRKLHDSIKLNQNLHMLHKFLNPLESVMKCVEMNYLTIITGSSATGKSSIVRLLAHLTGHVLNEFSMTSSTDTIELLGGFEQSDPTQNRRKLSETIKLKIDAMARTALSHSLSSIKTHVSELQKICNLWNVYQESSKVIDLNEEEKYLSQLQIVLEELHKSSNNIQAEVLSQAEYTSFVHQISQLQTIVQQGLKGRFEWTDGTLIRSMLSGQWILIDNVNFCNATVLDRLNSVLEPNGVLVLNEKGLQDGETTIIKPHPDFRIFMTMDPKYGEVSRAMRNRGVEMYLMPIDIPSHDALTLLNGTGINSVQLCKIILSFHEQFCRSIVLVEEDKPSLRDLLRVGEMICYERSQMGKEVVASCKDAISNTYIRNKNLNEKQIAIAKNLLQSMDWHTSNDAFPESYSYDVFNITSHSLYNHVMRDASLLYFYIRQFNGRNMNFNNQIASTLIPLADFSNHQLESVANSKTEVIDTQRNNSTDFSLISHALKYFVERASLNDVALRLQLLQRCKEIVAQHSRDGDDKTELLRQLDKSLFILGQYKNSKFTSTALKNRQQTLLMYQPLSLLLNESLCSNMIYSNQLNKIEEEAAYNVLEGFILLISQMYDEVSYYASKKNQNFIENQASLLHQSFYFNINPAQKSRAAHDSIPLFVPLFKAVETCVMDLLNNNTSVPSEILLYKAYFWKYLDSTTKLTDEILIYWNWMIRHIYKIENQYKSSVQSLVQLISIIKQIDRQLCVLFDASGRKNVLWKRTGKIPIVSAATKAVRQQIEEFTSTKSKDIREVVLQALCTMEWLQFDEQHEIIIKNYIQQVVKLKSLRWEDKANEEVSLNQLLLKYYGSLKEGTNNQDAANFINVLEQHSVTNLVPLFNHRSLVMEHELLGEISQFAAKMNVLQAQDAVTLAHKCRAFITFCVENTTANPALITPYQNMYWILSSSKQEQNRDLLLGSMHKAILNWNQRLWNNSMNLQPQDDNATNVSHIGGPAELFQNMEGYKVLELLGDWKQVPIRAKVEKSEQFSKLVDFISTSTKSNDASSVLLKQSFYSIASTLFSYSKTFDTSVNAELVAVLEHYERRILHQNSNIEIQDGQLVRLISTSTDIRLKESAKLFTLLESSLFTLVSNSNEELSVISIARISCLIAFIRLQLLLPAQPIDPTQKFRDRVEFLSSDLKYVSDQLYVYKIMEEFITGSADTIQIRNLLQRMESLQLELLKTKENVVVRPQTVEFRELFRELRHFTTSLSDKEAFVSLIDKYILAASHSGRETTESLIVKEDVWQFNCAKFTQKLLTKYEGFEDVTTPLVKEVYQMKFGIRLLLLLAVKSNMKLSSQTVEWRMVFERILNISSNSLESIAEVKASIGKVIQSKLQTKEELEAIWLEALDLILFKLLHYSQSTKEKSVEFYTLLDSVMDLYNQIWNFAKTDYQKKKEEEEQLYKYKQKNIHIKSDDELLEDEMNEMFPTFENEFASFTPTVVGKSTTEESKKEASASSASTTNYSKLYTLFQSKHAAQVLLMVHGSLFHTLQNATSVDVKQQIWDKSIRICYSLFTQNNYIFDSSFDSNFAFTLFSLKSLENLNEKVASKVVQADSQGYDIYNDSNVPEVCLCFTVLKDFIAKMDQLLEKYEEHPALLQMIYLSEKILNMPVSTPLMKVLEGVNLLLRKAHEWEEYITSPSGTIKQEIAKVTGLILRWRKFELENWKSIRLIKEAKMNETIHELWFQFYKVLFQSGYEDQDENTSLNQFFSICDDILKNSKFGELKSRLALLKSFHWHLVQTNQQQSSPLLTKFANILSNMYKFYEQFIPVMNRVIEEQVKPLESKLVDFVKIMKWDDVNFDSVKHNSAKSRRKLAKFSKNFGAILQTASRSLWDNEIFNAMELIRNDLTILKSKKKNKKTKKKKERIVDTEFSVLNQIKSMIPSMIPSVETATSESISKNIGINKALLNISEKFILNGSAAVECDQLIPYLDNLCVEIMNRSAQFAKQSLIPTAKKRILLDILSELKELGVEYRSKAIQKLIHTQHMFEEVSSSSMEMTPHHAQNSDLITKSDDYYYKTVFSVQRMKHLAKNPSKDMNLSEVTRMLGYSENLLFMTHNQRNQMTQLFQEQTTLTQFASELQVFQTENVIFAKNQEQLHNLASQAQLHLQSLCELTHTLVAMYQSVKNTGMNQFNKEAQGYLAEAWNLCLQAQESMRHSSLGHILFTNLEEALLKQVLDQVVQIGNLLENFNQKSNIAAVPNLSSMIDQGRSLFMTFSTLKQTEQNQLQEASLEEFETVYSKAVESIQLVIQNWKDKNDQVQTMVQAAREEKQKQQKEGTQQEEESVFVMEKSLERVKPFLENSTLANSLTKVNSALTSVFTITKQLLLNHSGQEISSHYKVLLALVSNLNGVMHCFDHMFLYYHKTLLKLAIVVSNVFAGLLKNGFGEKQGEEGEGEGDSNNTQYNSGTGMDNGEGEGLDDVSKEITDENQILNQNDMKPQENQDEDIKENDDGLEMENDFESKLFDKEKGDEEEEDEKEDEENMDRDMGEIDEDDPNKETLDKKLWDDNEDDNREEEVDQNDDDKSHSKEDNSEMRAKDDEEQESKGEQNKEKKPKAKPNEQTENAENQDEQPEEVEQEEFEDVVGEDGEEKQEDPFNKFKDNIEEMELPEDMNIEENADENEEEDGSEDEKEEQGDEESAAEAQKQPQEQQEDPNIDSEQIDMEEQEKIEEENMDAEEGEEEETSGLDPSLKEDKPNADSENKDDEEKQKQQGEDEEEKEDAMEQEEAFEENLKETPFGVKQTAGKSSEIKQDEKNEEAQEKEDNMGEEGGNDFNQKDSGKSAKQSSSKQDKKDKNENAERQFDPNPYKSLGDALKKWKEKLQIIEKENKENQQNEQNGQNEEEEAEGYEYKDNDDEMTENEQQILAPATEEQAKSLPELDTMQDEEEEEEQDENKTNLKDMKGDEGDEDEEDMDTSNPQQEMKNMKNKNPKLDDDTDMEELKPEEEEEDVPIPNSANEQEQMIDSTINTKEEEEEIAVTTTAEVKELTMEDVQKMREELDQMLSNWRNDEDNVNKGIEAWKRYDMLTSALAQELCEQLRLILEPTLATKLKGDYKTGKRINMKKVIPYIASQFRKDKIWLRRTKPNKRQYQVMVAIDDSMSMSHNSAGNMACESMTLICKALSQLEVGQLSIVSFGETMRLLHPFDRPFTDDSGAEVISQFTFAQKQTQMPIFLEHASQLLDAYRSLEMTSNSEEMQLCFIISDGRMLERDAIVKLVRQAHDKKQLFVFILIDNPNPKESVLEIKSISYPNNKLTITSYMDQFPFPYYIVLRDIQHLPEILADALRQWFELISTLETNLEK